MKQQIENKSLFELGEEYERCARLQQSFIDNCKRDIERAREKGDEGAVIKLEGKLYKFYAIKHEILETASHLKSYYR